MIHFRKARRPAEGFPVRAVLAAASAEDQEPGERDDDG